MSKLDALLIDARGSLAKHFGRPSFTAADYDDGVLEVAKLERRDGESVAAALTRLHDEGDERVRVLWQAARKAEAFADPRPAPEQLAKRSTGQDAVLAYAKDHARPGESEAQALDRLARGHDPELRRLYGQAVA
jgi:hypothetical protein